MHNIGVVFGFGWKYLRRYWVRVVAGVLFGIIFGLTNASFVWATKTLIERFRTPEAVEARDTTEETTSKKPGVQLAFFSGLKQKAESIQAKAGQFIEPWLPRLGREMDWHQIVGGILFR